jgi:hypothetical protein
MSEDERKVVTSTIENPTNYTKKITLGSLISVVETYGKNVENSLLKPSILP